MALTTTPLVPVAGEEVQLIETAAVGDILVWCITATPSNSLLSTGYLLDDDAPAGLSVNQVALGGYAIDTLTPDVAGDYSVTVYQLRRHVGITSFSGNMVSDWIELLTTATYTLSVGERITLPVLDTENNGAVLNLVVRDVAGAGVVSEVSWSGYTNEAARQATLTAGVVAAGAALVGVLVTNIGTELTVAVNQLAIWFNLHLVKITGMGAPIHVVHDTDNTVNLTSTHSQAGLILLLNTINNNFRDHLKNGTAAGGRDWHVDDDLKSTPVARAAVDMGSATVLAADLRVRGATQHRLLLGGTIPSCHLELDTNTITAGLLETLIATYLSALRNLTPTPATNEPVGLIVAAHRFGFKLP